MRKEPQYFKATRRAIVTVNSLASAKEKLDAIVRGTGRATAFAASLVLLDVTGTKLVHTSSWGLPQFFLRKGVLNVDKSLNDVTTLKPVAISDVTKDSRIQFPEMARKANIVSVLGVPVVSGSRALGSLRVYARERYDFTNQDIAFVGAMANLAATVLTCASLQDTESALSKEPATSKKTALSEARTVSFAHPSEAEFARILDFYNIEWVYEPCSFPLRREGERVTEMFTPDFYLPALDLYIELTTMKQSLATGKNRKLRLLRELHPEVKITLLHKSDYDHLLAKYGVGPLAQTRAHGIERILFSAAEIQEKVHTLAERISKDYADRRPLLLGIQRGFICFMADLIRQITVPLDVDFLGISYYSREDGSTVKITKDVDLSVKGRHVIIIEDIVDTGITLNYIQRYLSEREPLSLATCILLDRRQRRLVDTPLDYVCFEVPDEFVVGYGLDYREEYRNLPFIGVPIIKKSPIKRPGSR
ncbi:MAG: hypoxanthine phosphoribosyltransferase [Chloroflexota bacterium]